MPRRPPQRPLAESSPECPCPSQARAAFEPIVAAELNAQQVAIRLVKLAAVERAPLMVERVQLAAVRTAQVAAVTHAGIDAVQPAKPAAFVSAELAAANPTIDLTEPMAVKPTLVETSSMPSLTPSAQPSTEPSSRPW